MIGSYPAGSSSDTGVRPISRRTSSPKDTATTAAAATATHRAADGLTPLRRKTSHAAVAATPPHPSAQSERPKKSIAAELGRGPALHTCVAESNHTIGQPSACAST